MDARPPAYALVAAELLAACTVETFRSHGPGGQHANKTESAVRLTHRASGVTAQCQDHRERTRNQAEALHRLRLRLALHERGASRPEWLAEQRRGTRLALGPGSDSYPLVVAVLLDALVAAAGALAQAASSTGLSSSQIAKVLTADKEVHQAANAVRAAHGLGALHG
jgi:hypothetical protein